MTPGMSVISMFLPPLVLGPWFQFLRLGDDGGELSLWQAGHKHISGV